MNPKNKHRWFLWLIAFTITFGGLLFIGNYQTHGQASAQLQALKTPQKCKNTDFSDGRIMCVPISLLFSPI